VPVSKGRTYPNNNDNNNNIKKKKYTIHKRDGLYDFEYIVQLYGVTFDRKKNPEQSKEKNPTLYIISLCTYYYYYYYHILFE